MNSLLTVNCRSNVSESSTSVVLSYTRITSNQDLNEESGHEQNYTCKTLEFDASTDISEESRSEDIPNEDRDSDIELLDEKASFLRADKNVVSLESTKKNPLQISGKSIEEFKQFIINNKGKYDYGTFKSAKAFLCHWCPLNDLVETYDYQSINTVNTPVWLCTLTLKSADVGHFFTTDAYGKSKKRAGRLAAKKAVSYLFAETLVTSDEIKAMNLSVTKGDTKLLSFVSDTRNHNIKHVSPNVDPMPEKSVSAFPQKVSDNMDDKLELQEWCSKNGLKMQFETQQLEKTQYTCKVKVESYLYVGTGKGSKSDSERMACQDFIDHLKKVDNCQISSHEDPKSALNSWCSKQQLELSIKKEIFGEKIVVCYAKVESFDFVGRGIATKRKLAERMACQNFINHLEAKQNEVHSSVGSDDSQNINLSSEISRKKFDELHQDNEINFSNRIVPFGTAQIRLQQFFEENNINTDYTYTTDSVSLEGYHVASMKFYIRRSGRSFSASANAITVEAAKEECAFSLVKQLYSANLIHAKTKTQRKSIRPATSPIKLNVSDDLIEIITQLCTDFKVDAPELIPNKKGTNPILLSSLPSKYEDTNSSFKDDVLQLKTGIARMNWNAWSSRQIKKDQRHHNVSLKDMSKTIKTSQSKNSNSSTFRKRLKDRQNLPIFQSRNRILKLVDDHSVTIIKGSTGSGKSTQVCQYILDDAINNNMGSQCNIVVIEPRRICVTSLADRVAYERNERIGKSVGYCVRFDSSYPRAYGAILFCTPGSFLRRAESGLIGISHIIVDEIHERNIDTDYILLILHRLLKTPTPLKVILMSADVDIELFSSYFDNCGHITVKGKSHRVKDYFLEDCIKLINFKFKYPICQSYVEEQETEDVPPSTSNKKSEENLNSQSGVQDSSSYTPETLRAMALIDEQTVCPDLIEAIISWIREQRILGSILVFLPGWASIMQVTKHLEESKFRNSYSILPLHSKVKDLEKRQVFLPAPHGKTKVILSTSIAESSITIDDVVCVIDSCKTRISISQNNLSFKYVTEWASKVNLNQRLGRAGRLRPGYCFRLCTKARYEELPADIEPEMYRLPLYNIVLSIKTLKLRSIREVLYSALQPPPLRSIEEAERLLVELKCLDSHLELTPLGKIVARLPLDPRLSKMLLMSTLFDCPYQMLKLAAFTSVQEEFLECPPEATENVAKERYSDHLAVLYTLSTGEQLSYYQKFYENTPFKSYDEIIRIEEQLHSILERVGFDLTSSYGSVNKNTDIVTALLCQAFYPNICAFKQKRKVYLPGGKIGLVSKNSLIGSNNNDFKPPSRIFVFGEMTEAQVNICRNLTMISPMHLLCFTNCKVVFEKGVVKIDDWLPLKMDPNAAASIMCVRTMIEKVLHDIALDPSSRGATEHQRLSIAVQQLCKTDFDHRVVNAPQPSSSNHPENNNN